MEDDNQKIYSIEYLEGCSYRFLQQTAKSLSLPSNVKKSYLIHLIYTKKHCSQREVDDLVTQVRLERQQHCLARKKAMKRKKHIQQSTEISSTTSNSQSPPITNTPKRLNHVFIRYSPETHTPYRGPRAMPTKTNTLNASDRVLRSFKRVKKPTYLLDNALLSLIKSSEDRSKTRVNIVSKEKYQKINYVRKTNISGCVNTGELVPVARSANIMPSSAPVKRQRRLSGIYPLATKDIRLPNVAVRRPDGTLCKINAIIQRPLTQHNYIYNRPTTTRNQSLLKLLPPDDPPQTASKSCQTTPNFTNRTKNKVRRDSPKHFGYRTSNIPESTVTSTFGNKASNLPKVTSASEYIARNLPEVTSAFGYRAQQLPDLTSTVDYRQQNLPDVTSALRYRGQNLPEVASDLGYRSQNVPESSHDYIASNLPTHGSKAPNFPELTFGCRIPNLPDFTNFTYRAPSLTELTPTFSSPNLAEVTPSFEYRTLNLPEVALDEGYRAQNNSLVEFPQSNLHYNSPGDTNLLNMKENQSEEYAVYYHKKIRAEQVRSLRCRDPARCVENEYQLPRINEVFSKFNNMYCRDVTQPIYVQVDSEPEIPLNYIPESRKQHQGCNSLEKLYNLKSLNQPLLQISTTTNTHTVYCTPVISTVKAQPSSATMHNAYNTASESRDSQPCFIDEEIPRVHDFFRNFRCEEENIQDSTTMSFRDSSSSTETQTSQEQAQELGANVTIPEMVEDALEIISQDGDYLERMGMDIRMQCVLCDWAGPKMILEYHIRKEHASDIVCCPRGSCSATYCVRGLAARAGWARSVLACGARLYVLSVRCAQPACACLLAALMMISDVDSPKSASMTIYNKVTGEPLTWQGDVTPLPAQMADNDPSYFRVPFSRLDLVPNGTNLKLINRQLVVESPNKAVDQPDLNNIHISLLVKIFD